MADQTNTTERYRTYGVETPVFVDAPHLKYIRGAGCIVSEDKWTAIVKIGPGNSMFGKSCILGMEVS